MPTGRYSAPERYTEKLLQALIVHAKQEGIDTIYIHDISNHDYMLYYDETYKKLISNFIQVIAISYNVD